VDEVLERLTAIEWAYADYDLGALTELKRRIADRARTSNPLQSYSELVEGVVFHLPNVAGGTPYEIDTSEWTSLAVQRRSSESR